MLEEHERKYPSMDVFLDYCRKDVDIKKDAPRELKSAEHAKFIINFVRDKTSYEYITTESFRMSGIYWCLESLDLMGKLSEIDADEIASYVKKCQLPSGGFAGAENHDAHLLSTLSAVQILTMLNRLDKVDVDAIARYVKSLQNEDGSFGGDECNEVDTRFSFSALATLHLIGRLKNTVNIEKAVDFIMCCYNCDGGFGRKIGSESHAGQVFCCLGSLAIVGCLEAVNVDRTARWLAERQCQSGGLNGRPEKLPDVCYSWWVLASLAILERVYWVEKKSMITYILACQNNGGGFADRPGDVADPFHTVFGLAGLSLLGNYSDSLEEVDAVFCMTKKCLGDLSIC